MLSKHAIFQRIISICIITIVFVPSIASNANNTKEQTSRYLNNISRILPKATQNVDVQILHQYSPQQDCGRALAAGTNGYLYCVVHSFTNGMENTNPSVLIRMSQDGTNYKQLYGWPLNYGNITLISASDGSVYVRVFVDGDPNIDPNVLYQVYKIADDGSLLPIITLDKNQPYNHLDLFAGTDGSLYGNASTGSNSIDNLVNHLVKIDKNGSITPVYQFNNSDLSYIAFQGNDNYFYGVRNSVNTSNSTSNIFKISPSGVYTLLSTINSSSNVGTLLYGLVMGANGDIFGKTLYGQSSNTANTGNYFKLSPSGQITLIGKVPAVNTGNLHVFSDGFIYDFADQSVNHNDGFYSDWEAIIQLDQENNINYFYFLPSVAGSFMANIAQGPYNIIYGLTQLGGFGSGNPSDIYGYGDGTIFQIDLSIPSMPTVSSITSSVPPSSTNWYSGKVDLTLGVATLAISKTKSLLKPNATTPIIKYTIDNGTEQTYQSPISITNEGAHKVTYWSYNGSRSSAKQNITIQVDKTAPLTTSKVAGTSISTNTYNRTATITLSAADNLSGVTATYYQIDNGSKQTYNNPITISTIGQHTITYYSADNAGNIESAKQISFAIGIGALHSFAPGIQMISSPVDSSGFTLLQIFDKSDLKISAWDPSTLSYITSPTSPSDTMHPGKGYWAKMGSTTNLMDYGLHPNSSTPLSITLNRGWNLIGTPCITPVAINSTNIIVDSFNLNFSVAVAKGYLYNTIFTYQPGDTKYQSLLATTTTINPYIGYWIYAFKKCTLNFPPSNPQ